MKQALPFSALAVILAASLGACGKPSTPADPAGTVPTPPASAPATAPATQSGTGDASTSMNPTDGSATGAPAGTTGTGPDGMGTSGTTTAGGNMPGGSTGNNTGMTGTQAMVPLKLINAQGMGADAGSVTLSDGAGGLMIATNLKGLPAGAHGFHIHQNGDCGPGMKDGKTQAGIAAGEHYDPASTGKHAGPSGMGHAGDLPQLTVAADGTATTTLTVAKLKLADIKGKSVMVHADPDDYAGKPGGARIACGVVP